MSRVKKLFALVGLVGALMLPAAPLYAQGAIDPALCQQNPQATLCQENSQTSGDNASSNSIYGPDGIFTKVMQLLGIVIGVASVIMIIVGGLRYIMSSGDPNGVNGAKNTILYAIIGLVVAALSQVIVIFVISEL